MSLRSFADGTVVSKAKTMGELARLLEKFGATGQMIGEMDGCATVAFEAQKRRVLIRASLPNPKDEKWSRDGRERLRSPSQRENAIRRETDRIWRVLLMSVKAKMVSVADEVETFEQAFMAHVVMPDGMTVCQHLGSRIADAYATGRTPPLLGAPQ
ncbi:MAG: hypothetical protein ACE37J_11740 [Pikeienuella sp.]|uniref:hypothetical protein n=1 Tax=Pikeienuella sp. TaxID=2831957 RepID=UPI0039196C99